MERIERGSVIIMIQKPGTVIDKETEAYLHQLSKEAGLSIYAIDTDAEFSIVPPKPTFVLTSEGMDMIGVESIRQMVNSEGADVLEKMRPDPAPADVFSGDDFVTVFGNFANEQGETWRLQHPELMDAYEAYHIQFPRKEPVVSFADKHKKATDLHGDAVRRCGFLIDFPENSGAFETLVKEATDASKKSLAISEKLSMTFREIPDNWSDRADFHNSLARRHASIARLFES